MADNEGRVEEDVTDPASQEHGEVRSRFVELWNERTSGEAGAVALDSAWQPIAKLLDVHASAETEVTDPVSTTEGSDEATDGRTEK